VITFEETQRFTQWWIWLPIGGVAALAWFGVYQQVVLGRPWGTNPAPDGVLLFFWLLTGIGLPVLFGVAHLRAEVRDEGLYLRHFPFHLRYRHWPFDEIVQAQPVRYSPLREYGGWGIRLGRAGWAYNVKGDLGVQVLLRSGKQILIGSQYPEDLAEAISAGLA
jgi:hypothetical protein